MSLITSVSGVLVDAESKDDEETFEDSKDNLDNIIAMIEDAREGIIGAVAEGEALLSETTRKPKRKHDDATTFTGGSNQLALLFPDGPTDGIEQSLFSHEGEEEDEEDKEGFEDEEPVVKKTRTVAKNKKD